MGIQHYFFLSYSFILCGCLTIFHKNHYINSNSPSPSTSWAAELCTTFIHVPYVLVNTSVTETTTSVRLGETIVRK